MKSSLTKLQGGLRKRKGKILIKRVASLRVELLATPVCAQTYLLRARDFGPIGFNVRIRRRKSSLACGRSPPQLSACDMLSSSFMLARQRLPCGELREIRF